jgi:hypothetical protein
MRFHIHFDKRPMGQNKRKTKSVKPRYSALLYTATLTLRPRNPQNRTSQCNFKETPTVQRHFRKPPSPNINVPLNIIIKSDTAPRYFVSTGYTGKSLEYSVVKIPHTNLCVNKLNIHR